MHATYQTVPVISPILVAAAAARARTTQPAKPESQIDPDGEHSQRPSTFGWQPTPNNLVSTNVTQRKFDETIRQSITTTLSHKGYAAGRNRSRSARVYEIGEYDKKKSSSPFSVGSRHGQLGRQRRRRRRGQQRRRFADGQGEPADHPRGQPQGRQRSVARHDDRHHCARRECRRHQRLRLANAERIPGQAARKATRPLVRRQLEPHRNRPSFAGCTCWMSPSVIRPASSDAFSANTRAYRRDPTVGQCSSARRPPGARRQSAARSARSCRRFRRTPAWHRLRTPP